MSTLPKVKETLTIVILLGLFILPLILNADVTVLSLDTSGSMKNHGFSEAKAAILKTLQEIDGPVLINGFDVNDYEIWHGTINDKNREGVIRAITQKLSALRPTGPYTHIEEALDCGKVFLLCTKGSGARKLIIFSDGINQPERDVDKHHKPIDLTQIAESIMPQSLGFSVYFIGLSPDLEQFFNTKADSSGFIAKEQYPHIKGVPLKNYNPSSVKKAFTKAVDDTSTKSTEPSFSNEQVKGFLSWFKRHWLLIGLIIFGGVFAIVIFAGFKNRNEVIEKEEEPETKTSESFGDFYDNSLQLVIKSRELPTVSYPLMNGTVYTLGVDIPIPSIDQGIAIITMEKEKVWIEPLTEGILRNDEEINEKTLLSAGDIVQFKDVTINITSVAEEDDLLVPVSGTENSDEASTDLSDEDLNLF